MERPEQKMQKAVVAHLRIRATPGVVFFHVPNGVRGGRRKDHIQGAIAKGMGVRAGVSDLILVHDFKVFALELKAPGGGATEAQLEFLSDMENAGAYTACIDSLDGALNTLTAWGLLQGRCV